MVTFSIIHESVDVGILLLSVMVGPSLESVTSATSVEVVWVTAAEAFGVTEVEVVVVGAVVVGTVVGVVAAFA